MRKFLLIFILPALFLSACGSDKDKENEEKVLQPEQYYNRGMDEMQGGKYKKAIADFEKIEQNYPYSQWATKGKIMAAYTNYKAGEYDDAANMLETYIKLHPGNQDIAYAYYLRALCYYERIADVQRDQEITQEALADLKEVVRRFPDTEYGRDAKIKLDLVVDHLAGKEMEIGRYYLKRKIYVGAINRFRNVVDKFDTTSHVPEALERLVECYLAMGVKDQAQKYAAVLGYNYPSSKWYKYSYKLLAKEGVSGKAS